MIVRLPTQGQPTYTEPELPGPEEVCYRLPADFTMEMIDWCLSANDGEFSLSGVAGAGGGAGAGDGRTWAENVILCLPPTCVDIHQVCA